MEPLILTDPRDRHPSARLKQFRRELAETETTEESIQVLRRHLDPDPIVVKGMVTRASDSGTQMIPWRESHFAYHAPGTIPRSDAAPIYDDQGRALPHAAVPLKRAPAGRMEFKHSAPRRRDPLERVESLTRRYVSELKRGNTAVLEGLLSEVCAGYWKAGMPVTVEDLRMLAAQSLSQAEGKRKAFQYKEVTSEVVR